MLAWFLLFACQQPAADEAPQRTSVAEEQRERRALDPTASGLPRLPASMHRTKRYRLPNKAPKSVVTPEDPRSYLDLEWVRDRMAHPGGQRPVDSVRAESHVWWGERYQREAAAYRRIGEKEAALQRLEDALDHHVYGDVYLAYAEALEAVDRPADAAAAYRLAVALGVGRHEKAWAQRAAALCTAGDSAGAWLAAGVATLEGAGSLASLTSVECLDRAEQHEAWHEAIDAARRGEVAHGRWLHEEDQVDLCAEVTVDDSVIYVSGEVALDEEQAVMWWLGIDPPGWTRAPCS